jgi:hypothetical protein
MFSSPGPEVLWSKYRWYCKNPARDRLSFFDSTPQVLAAPLDEPS